MKKKYRQTKITLVLTYREYVAMSVKPDLIEDIDDVGYETSCLFRGNASYCYFMKVYFRDKDVKTKFMLTYL